MPEGDTVWHTAATLRRHLAGRTLTRCDIRVPRFAAVDLTGEVVDEVISRGKHLFIRTGTASIHSHLQMDGSWRVATGRCGWIIGRESFWKPTSKNRPSGWSAST